MRVLVLHSDVAHDAPPDELDTLATAAAVSEALARRGHVVVRGAFVPEPVALNALLDRSAAEAVFNLVESVHCDGMMASLAPAMLEKRGIAYTGAGAACLALTTDKLLFKRIARAAGLPTAAWTEAPEWKGLELDARYIVKSATEDASLGLEDASVVMGHDVPARAHLSAARHGGRWFAEAWLDGREFNVAMLEEPRVVRVLPIPEMRFEDWPEDRPRIVGYDAKWDETTDDAKNTVRTFGIENEQPALAATLKDLALKTWSLSGMRGYARVDLRLDARGEPMLLEANPNPCLEPHAGFAAAATEAGLSYENLVERILRTARVG